MSVRRLAVTYLLAAAVRGALPADAAVFEHPPTDPSAPTAGQPVVARVHESGCAEVPVTVVRDEVVLLLRANDEPCPIITPPETPSVRVDLGLLPAGTYDLRLVRDVEGPGDPPQTQITDEAIVTVAPPPCAANALCLQRGRFEISAQWRAPDGTTGAADPVPLTDETGSFWFFGPENLELMVKMLDGCAINDRFWFYAAGLTDVEVVLRVRDLGFSFNDLPPTLTYANALGHPFEPVSDTASFFCTALP